MKLPNQTMGTTTGGEQPPAKSAIFAENAPLYWAKGFSVTPTAKYEKSPKGVDGWNAEVPGLPSEAKRNYWLEKHAAGGIGFILGTDHGEDVDAAVDNDHPGFGPFLKRVLGNPPVGKVGGKGTTWVMRAEKGLKSVKLRARDRRDGPHAAELMINSGMVKIPPSHYDQEKHYRWEGSPILEVPRQDWPLIDKLKYEFISMVCEHVAAWEIVEGGAGIKAHEAMLKLTACGVANLTDDHEWMADCINALFHPDYDGNTASETLGMLESAKEKGLGQTLSDQNEFMSSDASNNPPVAKGYTSDGYFVVHDMNRNILVSLTSTQMMNPYTMYGIVGPGYLAAQFPAEKTVYNTFAAGNTLMDQCRRAGPFDPSDIRGVGVWIDNGKVVKNFGQEPLPPGLSHTYTCFKPLAKLSEAEFNPQALHDWLKNFNWQNPQSATLFLGYLAMAPICGAIAWRPHAFVHGVKNTGKTTLLHASSNLLYPLRISCDGNSTEAGIRQALGPDSRPVVIDEFESDHNRGNLQAVVKLARSASSAENAVLRGTPEGRVIQYNLRATFLFAAINPIGMSSADDSRILQFEILPHQNDEEIFSRIVQGEIAFRNQGPQWCGHTGTAWA